MHILHIFIIHLLLIKIGIKHFYSIGESDPATISDDTLMVTTSTCTNKFATCVHVYSTVAIDYFIFQNLVDITDNLYNPQNEVAYSILDNKEEVRELFNEGEGTLILM